MVPIIKRHATLKKEHDQDHAFVLSIDNQLSDVPYRGNLYLEQEELEDLYFVLDQYFKLYAENPLGNKTKT